MSSDALRSLTLEEMELASEVLPPWVAPLIVRLGWWYLRKPVFHWVLQDPEPRLKTLYEVLDRYDAEQRLTSFPDELDELNDVSKRRPISARKNAEVEALCGYAEWRVSPKGDRYKTLPSDSPTTTITMPSGAVVLTTSVS
jgi:hypothetical protein